jgi:hypothetical protein
MLNCSTYSLDMAPGGHCWLQELTAVLSSIMNNMPTVLIGALSIHATQATGVVHQAMVYANIIGCDQVVAAYVVAAYWSTSSTSLGNPAVTIAHGFTDTFSGIWVSDVAPFIIAQFFGGLATICRHRYQAIRWELC